MMNRLVSLGRIFFAAAIVAFGVEHLLYRDFVTRIVPKLPAAVPEQALLAIVLGVLLVVVGLAILLGKSARAVALFLGAFLLFSFAVFYLPALLANPYAGAVWTFAGKALALAGGSFLVAGTFPRESRVAPAWLGSVVRALERLIPYGRFMFAAFLVLAGVQHFIYPEFVATLVPSWVPGALFWTYFAGVALVAGGVGIVVPQTTRLAGLLTALMIFLWVVTLHVPRALAAPGDSNETTAVFEAIAMTGIALLAALAPKGRS